MQTAQTTDQSVIKQVEPLEVEYTDHSEVLDVIIFEDLFLLYESKKDKLTKEEIKNAKRVLDETEENSYVKLQTFLMSK